MAEVEEIFDGAKDTISNAGKNLKKLIKSKPFMVAAGGAAVVALFLAWKNSQTSDASLYESDYYYPSGYSGYPSVDTGGGSGFESTETVATDTAYFDSMADQLYGQIENLTTSMSNLQEESAFYRETAEAQAYEIERSNAISQMQKNSELYNLLSGAEYADIRADLHVQNLSIGKQYGLTFDPQTGNYFDADGTVAYLSSKQSAVAYTGKVPAAQSVSYDVSRDYQAEIISGLTSGKLSATQINALNDSRNEKIKVTGATGKISYDKNVDYQSAINQAKKIGASKQVISNLEAQRSAKIAGENLNADGSKKNSSSSSNKASNSSSTAKKTTSTGDHSSNSFK